MKSIVVFLYNLNNKVTKFFTYESFPHLKKMFTINLQNKLDNLIILYIMLIVYLLQYFRIIKFFCIFL